MDEYDSGMDPEVKIYFRKILRSLGAVLLWTITCVTSGIFFRLAIIHHHLHWYNLIFYGSFLVITAFFVRYLYRLWK